MYLLRKGFRLLFLHFGFLRSCDFRVQLCLCILAAAADQTSGGGTVISCVLWRRTAFSFIRFDSFLQMTVQFIKRSTV